MDSKEKHDLHIKSMNNLFFDLADVMEKARNRQVTESSAESEAVPQMDGF